jgi:IclR family transcriptional regulator, acetate operon repressor
VLILDEAFGSHVLGNTQTLGTRWPLHATSTGKVLLASLPEAQREALLAAGLPRLTAHTLTNVEAFRAELDRVRAEGYAVAVEELEAGFTAVGAPVRNVNRVIVAALSVGGPSLRLTADRLPAIAAQVRAAADGVSHRLGS